MVGFKNNLHYKMLFEDQSHVWKLNLVFQNKTEYGIKFQFCQQCYKYFIAFLTDKKK